MQSSHLNFLLGGWSFLPVFSLFLGILKEELNSTPDGEKEAVYKKYFKDVMLPTKKVIRREYIEIIEGYKLDSTIRPYKIFFTTLRNILLKRKNTLLSKQVNIFTTNIDLLQEHTLDIMRTGYNDGFSGNHTSIFRVENFRRIIKQKSLHFDYESEIPIFNIIKMHGSLNWRLDKEDIFLSHDLSHIDEKIEEKVGDDFLKSYEKIQIVNPENIKHLETVLNFYYSELLRLYSSTLEKENSALFVIGFSMNDKHIRKITLRAARSNPTLQVYVFCYEKQELEEMEEKLETKGISKY